MIYAIARLNILGMLSILIEKTERSDTTNLQSSIVNIQFRLVRVGSYRVDFEWLQDPLHLGVVLILKINPNVANAGGLQSQGV
jgi:hypothetical protein